MLLSISFERLEFSLACQRACVRVRVRACVRVCNHTGLPSHGVKGHYYPFVFETETQPFV